MASIINFLPNQDLNGYDHPWPAGGNKNLYNSATDTPNAWIRANEPVGEIISTTYNYRLTDYIAVLPNTTYTINYNLSSTATSAGMVFFSEKEETAIVGAISLSKQTHSVNEGEPVNSYTFTTAENCNYLRFSTFPGSNNIQLELGDTATDYAPHSNICPITAPVHIVGKNLFNPWINGYYSPTSGKMAGTGMTTDITSRPIYAKAGTVFTLSQVTSSYAYSFEEWSICPQSSSDMVAANLLARSSNVTGGRRTYTVQNDCYVTFRSYRPPGTAVETAKIQAELGDTATEYEPYTETPIYGGYLDIGNNEIVEGWIKIILNENVNLATGGDSYEGTKGTNRIILLDLRSAYAVAGTSKHILDKIKTVYTYTWGQPNEHIWESCINAYKQLHIVFDNQTVGITTEMTKAERTAKIRAWLTNNPLEVAYQLETPIHHTLNSAQLAYIMAELNVRYSSMLESRRRIIMNSPHIETATGSTAFFKTDLKAPIKDCKIYFTPEQEGTGDPSPTNIRPITGWSGLTVRTMGSIWNRQKERGIINSNGQEANISGNDTRWRNVGYIPVVPDSKIKLWFNPTSRGISNIRVFRYDSEKTRIADQWVSPGVEITITSSTYFIRFHVDTSYGAKDPTGEGLAIDYSPNINAYSVDWSNDAGAIYGGYLDLINGELVAEYGQILFDGSISWGTPQKYQSIYRFVKGPRVAGYPAAKNSGKVYFNYLKSFTGYAVNNGFVGSTGNILIFTDSSIDTGAGLMAYQEDNPLQAVYELADPIHYSLTPEQIKTLKGVNNIYANTNGNIELKYWTH